MVVGGYHGEVKVSVPPARLWKALVDDGHKLVPRFVPIVDRIEIIGDGGVGTTRVMHLDPDLVVGKQTIRSRVEEYDERNFYYKHVFITDPAKFDSVSVSYKLEPAGAGGRSTVVSISSDYETADDYDPTEEEMSFLAGKERSIRLIKAIESYLLENPHLYDD